MASKVFPKIEFPFTFSPLPKLMYLEMSRFSATKFRFSLLTMLALNRVNFPSSISSNSLYSFSDT